MPVSKSKMEANHRYDEKAYFRITTRFKKDFEPELRKYCGDSLNGFIVAAVTEKIERIKNGLE